MTARRLCLLWRLACLPCLIAAALCATLSSAVADSVTDSRVTPGRRPWVIAMVTWRGETRTEAGFRDYLADAQLPVKLVSFDAGQKGERLTEIIAEIRKLRPDLIYAWGSEVCLRLFGSIHVTVQPNSDFITDIPAVFVNVSVPLEIGLVRSLEASGRNLTGSLFLPSPEALVQAMKSFRPFNRLAIIYVPDTRNFRQKLAQFRDSASRWGFTLEEIPLGEINRVPTPEDIESAVEAAASHKPDFLYLPSDTFLVQHKAALTAAAVRHRLAVFGSTEELLQDSQALAGLIGRAYDVGQVAGAQAEEILVRGRHPEDMPIVPLPRYSFVLNMQVARSLDLYPPISLLHVIEVRNAQGRE